MEELIIVFSFAAFVCLGIYRLIRAKIEQNNGINDETFERLARAFMHHRKETEQRLQNLEAIVTEEPEHTKKTGNSHRAIELPDEEEKEKDESGPESQNNLRNMLRE